MKALFLTELVPHLAQASWQASVLVLLILGLRRALGTALSPRWRCALWLLVVIRLAWPFSIPSSVSIFNMLALPFTQTAPESLWMWMGAAVAEWGARALRSPWVTTLWLAGGATLLGRVGVSWLWLCWRLRGTRPIESWDAWWLLQECRDIIGVRATVKLVESPHLPSPCVAGLFSPRLILPRGAVGALTREELRDVFLHELAHLRRSDIPLGWIFEVVKVLHWFNPLFWLVCSRMSQDREEACDELALARSAPGHPRAYGSTLLKILEGVGCGRLARISGLASWLGESDPLTHRLQFILGFRHGARTWVVGSCTCIAVAMVGLTDSAQPDFHERVESLTAAKPRPARPLAVDFEAATHVRPSGGVTSAQSAVN